VPVRDDLAMTGEITLHGEVLPVGGIKQKVLAAQRAGIRTVILPAQNSGDVDEIPAELSKGMNFHLVDHVTDVLELVLAHPR
jgi:ATP-dependent Lon protease